MADIPLAQYRDPHGPTIQTIVLRTPVFDVRCSCAIGWCSHLFAYGKSLFGEGAPNRSKLKEILMKAGALKEQMDSVVERLSQRVKEAKGDALKPDAQAKEVKVTSPKEVEIPKDVTLHHVVSMLKELLMEQRKFRQALMAGINLTKRQEEGENPKADVSRKELPVVQEDWGTKMARMYKYAHRLDQLEKGWWACGSMKCPTCKWGKSEQNKCVKIYFPAWKKMKMRWLKKFGKKSK